MKLIIAIISKDDSSTVMKELVKQKHIVTKLASTGGFLRGGNTTLMLGVAESKVDEVIDIISKFSKTRKEIIPSVVMSEFGITSATPIEISVGGATLFILDVEKSIKL